jgi:hypothetical protein
MGPPAEEPLSFDRVAQARLAGCLAYLLLIPTFGLVVSLIVGLLMSGLWHLAGWRDGTIPMICAAAGFLWAIWFAIRGYRMRAGTRILVFSDRLELAEGKTPVVFRYDDLLWISGPSLDFLSRPPSSPLTASLTLTLKRKDGRQLRLRNEEWPLREIGAALQTRAVPSMARAMGDRLDAGETLQFRPGLLLAFRYLIFGAIGTGLGGFWLFLGLQTMKIEKSYKPLGLPVLVLLAGLSALVMVGRAKGALEMDRIGVRARRRDPVLPWERIVDVQVLPDALNIKGEDGSVLSLGMLARNYDACLELIRRRRPAKG